ncbi:MaoC family dehydratase [Gordonia liuliyuniae]|uniref:MaoC family dehydratase n=1 Tax=Gordonia liuliyuniae TaxID=2911517 RepID=A0ABS9ITH8_9ACTN|nr:MaoC family dehydratase [Gordonia liuliyuniae]MCF8588847.1 MaoC family dehydratase [Gordonia liuliyuniae]
MTRTLNRPPITDVGTTLPESTVPISATLIVSGAIATRDFQKVHHDRDVAVAAGTKDIFMNILSTNGLVNRYVTEWAGPTSRISRINIRLGAPNFPGDTMTFTGEVTARDGDDLTVALVGTNSMGAHVTGTVQVGFWTDEKQGQK